MVKRMNFLSLSTILLILFAAAFSLQAQYEDSLCAYTWQSNINDCDSVIECIDIVGWNNKIKNVPFNISRISPDSLKLCMGDLSLTAPVDIIYVMDLSRSMITTYNPSGDPWKKRDDALRAGFQYQIDSLKESHAGYVGFGSTIPSDHVLAPINVITGQTQLINMADHLQTYVDNDQHASGTNYRIALDQAVSWLGNPTYCPHDTKAIIFISDGEPNAGDSWTAGQLSYFQTNNIEVHGIFLGANMGTALQDLATQTGGTSTLVPPLNNDTLATVVENIVSTYIDEIIADEITLINSTTRDTVKSIGEYPVNDTIWGVKLNDFLPLVIGQNQITVYSKFTSVGGYDTTLDFSFHIDVTASKPYTSECYYCWHRAELEALIEQTVVDTLTWQNDTFNIRLEYFGEDTLNQIQVSVKTPNKQDSETAVLQNGGWNGEAWVFKGPMPFKVTTNNAGVNNDTTEAAYSDFVYLQWVHPKDTRDSAFDTVIVSSPPNNIKIYDKLGDPATVTMKRYKTSPDTTVVIAGDTAQLFAKVFAENKWLSEYETNQSLGNLITWSFVDIATNQADTSVGNLTGTNGNHNKFYPKKAGKSVDVTASLKLSGLPEVKETIRLFIIAGPAAMLVIEASLDSTISPWDPAPYDPITIFFNETTKTAYGILRDKEGNWVSPAEEALWTEDDATVATVTPGPSETVTITKNPTNTNLDTTLITAAQSGLQGTSNVIIIPYQIDSLRIVALDGGSYKPIDSLTMYTDDDSTIYVQGRRSDNGQWILVNGNWGIDNSNATENQPPQGSNNWNVKPAIPATGKLWSALGSHADTINYRFLPSGPRKVLFTLLTPDSLCIAGRTLTGLVEIFNQDGHVPGTYKYDGSNLAKYVDTLGDGGLLFKPFGKTYFSTSSSDSDQFNPEVDVEQWFEGGIDTLEFTLYWAATSKTEPQKKHKLRVWLGSLTDPTREFYLLPGPIDTIVLTPDTLPILDPNGNPITIIADGYDPYGNYIPDHQFNWTNDTSLVDYNFNIISDKIIFDPHNANNSQQGWIWVRSVEDSTVWNKIYINIIVKSTLSHALTRDFNGNGFLDAIEVQFNKEFVIPSGYLPNNILVENPNPLQTFKIDSLVSANPGGKTKIFFLHLNEDDSKLANLPQTGWKPTLEITDLDSINDINTTCEDGAGPVAWTAVKEVKNANDRTKDLVTITCSENIYNFSGANFMSAGPKPPGVYNIWRASEDSIKVDTMLQGIDLFEDQQATWTLFKMKNGHDLNSNHKVNIDPNQYLADYDGNIPNKNNQKIRIQVKGKQGDINIGPNPFNVNINYYNNHINNLIHNLNIHQLEKWVNTIGGTIIEITVIGGTNIVENGIEVSIIVFDAVGNLVTKRNNPNILDLKQYEYDQNLYNEMKAKIELLKLGREVKFHMYYEGMNDRGMKCAPGVYRLIVYTIYEDDKGKQKRKANEILAITNDPGKQ